MHGELCIVENSRSRIATPSHPTRITSIQAYKHTSMTCSARLFREIGREIIGTTIDGDGRTFIAFFGVTPLQVHQLWQLIVDAGGRRWNDEKWSPCHLMWALLLLRTYNREEILAAMAGVDEKTYRKWAWILIERLSKIENLVSAAPGEDCFSHYNTFYCYY